MCKALSRRTMLAAVFVFVCIGVTPAAADPRIVGGEPTTHAWPAQANIDIDGALCGGTLVAPRWVLTAAHCITADDGTVVALSDVTATLGSSLLSGVGGTTHSVSSIVRNPSYDASTDQNDAALLQLTSASSQTPMAIIGNDALEFALPGATARVIGWGTTAQDGDVSDDLRQVDVPIVDDLTCAAPGSVGTALDPATMVCAGLAEGGKDSCQGDSGGPLMVNTGSGTTTGSPTSSEGWKLAGIVSFGDGCAQPGKYGVYTELANATIRSWVYTTIDGLPLGLRNPSFEQPLDADTDWAATVYDPTNNVVRSGADACAGGLTDDEARRRICRVGSDTFTITDPVTTTTTDVTVSPLDGGSMLRLGGPFNNAGQAQERDRYVAQQSFVVDPAKPVLELNYNMLTFDYTNFDELRLRVRLFDSDGDVVFNKVVGSFGPVGDTSFKSTGWRGSNIDLSPLTGESVTLRLDAGGTQDTLYGFWMYIDAGSVPLVVGEPGPPEIPAQTPGTPDNPPQPVIFQVQQDANGLTNYNFAASSAAAFTAAGQCLTLKLTVPINAGNGTTSNVSLLLQQSAGGTQQIALEDPDNDGIWSIPAAHPGICVQQGVLFVAYTLTEGGIGQDFVTPLGGVTLIDPQGVVYDKDIYDAEIASGESPDEARDEAALGGATVTLQRKGAGDAFQTVLSGDPGILPNINPQTTEGTGSSKGLYQWDVSAGDYRVQVVKAGYLDATSAVVSIPPPVLDLHIPLTRKKPVAAFTSPPVVQKDKQTTLTSSVTHPDGASAITSIEWDTDNDGQFDDGTGNTVAATYASIGDHTARIRATDDDGDAVVASGTVTVVARHVPVASFSVTGERVAGKTLTLTSTSTHVDGAASITAVAWDFDSDGTVDATGSSTTLTPPAAGSRSIKLTVTDDDGDSASASESLEIAAAPVTPPADTGTAVVDTPPPVDPPAAVNPPPPANPPAVAKPKPKPKPCAGKKGKALKRCQILAKRKAARQKCVKLKLKGKKKTLCLKKANAIGKPTKSIKKK